MRKDVIKTKLKEIEESIKIVEKNLPDKFEEFVKLGLIKDGIYKRMEFAIENVFDICAIINSDLELGIPSNDEDIVDNLVMNEIIDKGMKEKLKAMKGFRNILVHRYGKIDDRIAFNILKENIKDFWLFMEKIEDFLKKVK